jgi:hypothetical protein
VEHTQPTQTEQQPLSPPLPPSRQAESLEETTSPSILHLDNIDAADLPIANSPSVTRHRLMMERNIGASVRKVFFVHGVGGDVDYYEGKVHSITANNQYLII